MAKTIPQIVSEMSSDITDAGYTNSIKNTTIIIPSVTGAEVSSLDGWTTVLSSGKPRTFEIIFDSNFPIQPGFECKIILRAFNYSQEFVFTITDEVTLNDISTTFAELILSNNEPESGIIGTYAANGRLYIETVDTTFLDVTSEDNLQMIVNGDYDELTRFYIGNGGLGENLTYLQVPTGYTSINDAAEDIGEKLSTVDYPGSSFYVSENEVTLMGSSEQFKNEQGELVLHGLNTHTIKLSGEFQEDDVVNYTVNGTEYSITYDDLVTVDTENMHIDTFDSQGNWVIIGGWEISSGTASAI